jgi:hypothetical protein
MLACSWDNASYGYHGDDGQKFHGGGGQPFSEKFSKGAVIGAGYHLQRQEIFFTYAALASAYPRAPLLQSNAHTFFCASAGRMARSSA